MRNLSALVAITFLLLGCNSSRVKFDPCQVHLGGAHCYPENQPGKEEYDVSYEEMIGGWWVSYEDEAKLRKAKSDGEIECGQ